MINPIHSNTFEGGLYPRELTIEYRKIPKISPGAYIFLKAFFEGLISGGPYLRREICGSKSIGLAYSWKEFTVFALFYLVFEGNFQVQAPGGLLQHCCDIVSNGYNIVPALQRSVALKIVVANRLA